MIKILKKIKDKVYNFMPISRAEHLLALKNIAEIVNGLALADEQHSQMITSLLREQQKLQAQIDNSSKDEKPKNGNGVSKSYA